MSGGRYHFSSSFDYGNFVEQCCLDVGAPGAKLLARAEVQISVS